MVHNGIEYGDMQLCCEAYHLMKVSLGMTPKAMSEVFGEWNKGELDSFLIEITRDILAYTDEKGEPLVEKILDKAGQKGTWSRPPLRANTKSQRDALRGQSACCPWLGPPPPPFR